METDKMSTASSIGAAERRPLLRALVIERRILFACTVLVGLCTFVWIIAVSTSRWLVIDGGEKGKLLITRRFLLRSECSLWEMCRHVYKPEDDKNNETDYRNIKGKELKLCTNYLAQQIADNNGKIDQAFNLDVANYVRTMVSFAIISMFVMAMGCGFSVYTFRNPRYMFKRLAAGIHFISTSCTFVVVQVMMTMVDHLQKSVPFLYPPGATHYFHISFFLAWFVVLVNFFAAASFLWYSRKRKGDKAATDELAMADEPTIIGR